jgi:hypothetical protein
MTSIEWLIEQLDIITRDTNKYDDFKWIFEHEIDQAKLLHKQEIITAYAFGHNDGCRYMTNEKQEFEHGEGYYEETFKKD